MYAIHDSSLEITVVDTFVQAFVILLLECIRCCVYVMSAAGQGQLGQGRTTTREDDGAFW